MYLKALELQGFKSFPEKTRLSFEKDITVIVGPNGSGKSNLSDALLWVMGEQKTRMLRGGKMEDVIFGGTEKRGAMGFAQVTLVLDNTTRILPLDTDEVSIARRYYRSGESEYYINRQSVRLKDVNELFMDTGVGKASYSILEQGKIDQILSLKPEDRRYIFEEASGISRFKQQSDEAAKKLQKTDENMAQVELLLREAEKVYNSRKGQLDKVLKHRELSARKETLEVELQLSYLQSLTKLKDFRQEQQTKLENEAAAIDAVMDTAREGLDRQRNELEGLRLKRDDISANVHRNEEKVNSINTELDFYNERFNEVSQRTRDAKAKAQQVQERIEKDRQRLSEGFSSTLTRSPSRR